MAADGEDLGWKMEAVMMVGRPRASEDPCFSTVAALLSCAWDARALVRFVPQHGELTVLRRLGSS
jgi:hypothetical protein